MDQRDVTLVEKEKALLAEIENVLPEFAQTCSGTAEVVVIHQDSFAADYQDHEYALLGKAIKFAGPARERGPRHWQEPGNADENGADPIINSLVPPSATTTTTSVSATTSAVAASATTTFTPATASALRWSSFINSEITAHEVLAVESLDGASSFFIVVDFYEAKPTSLSRELVRHYSHVRDICARAFKPIA